MGECLFSSSPGPGSHSLPAKSNGSLSNPFLPGWRNGFPMCTCTGACRNVRELQVPHVQGCLQQQTGTEIASASKKPSWWRLLTWKSEIATLQLKKLELPCNWCISRDRRRWLIQYEQWWNVQEWGMVCANTEHSQGSSETQEPDGKKRTWEAVSISKISTKISLCPIIMKGLQSTSDLPRNYLNLLQASLQNKNMSHVSNAFTR